MSRQMQEFSEEDVLLAERYAAALKQIEQLGGVTESRWAEFTEEDVHLAERYARALQAIKDGADAADLVPPQ